jgi:hypothetical protein
MNHEPWAPINNEHCQLILNIDSKSKERRFLERITIKMYDDLFGDLSMAKGSSSDINTNAASTSTSTSTSAKTGEGNDKVDGDKQKQNDNDTKIMNTTATGKSQTKTKSIVESLGNAGTAVSFVPLALKKGRKRQQPFNTHVAATNMNNGTNTGTNTGTGAKKRNRKVIGIGIRNDMNIAASTLMSTSSSIQQKLQETVNNTSSSIIHDDKHVDNIKLAQEDNKTKTVTTTGTNTTTNIFRRRTSLM